MEEYIFATPAVAGQLNSMIEARLHNDFKETLEWQIELLSSIATPSFALVDPATGDLISKHIGSESDAEVFAEWLEESLESWEKR